MRRSITIAVVGGVAGALAACAYGRLRGTVSAPHDDHASLPGNALAPPFAPSTSADEGSNLDSSFVAKSAVEALANHGEFATPHHVAAGPSVEADQRRTRRRSRRLPAAKRLSSSASPLLLVGAAVNAGVLVAVLVLGGEDAQQHVRSWLELVF